VEAIGYKGTYSCRMSVEML